VEKGKNQTMNGNNISDGPRRRQWLEEQLEELSTPSASRPESTLHPAWWSFIAYCRELRHGDIELLRVQDGLPVLAELTRKKVKFAP